MALLALAAAALVVWLDRVSLVVAAAFALAVLTLAALAVWTVPNLVWRHWRYEIGETEVDLQHGWLTMTRTLIPLTRVQHVDTRRGPLQRRFGLASVVLFTAAGASEIPALADAVADAARDRIPALPNVQEDL